MPVHFQIYKYNPKTRERVVLHEMVPQAIVDWLREQSEGELSRKEKSQGVVVLKEPAARAESHHRSGTEAGIGFSQRSEKPERRRSTPGRSKRKVHRRAG